MQNMEEMSHPTKDMGISGDKKNHGTYKCLKLVFATIEASLWSLGLIQTFQRKKAPPINLLSTKLIRAKNEASMQQLHTSRGIS